MSRSPRQGAPREGACAPVLTKWPCGIRLHLSPTRQRGPCLRGGLRYCRFTHTDLAIADHYHLTMAIEVIMPGEHVGAAGLGFELCPGGLRQGGEDGQRATPKAERVTHA